MLNKPSLSPSEFWADGCGNRLVVAHILAATVGVIWAAAAVHRRRRRRNSESVNPKGLIPLVDLTGSGHVGRFEKFSHYVARQIGFEDGNECPKLSKLALEYARNSKGFEENMFMYFSNEKEAESLCKMLIQELERCIIAYFAFHWSQATLVVNEVLSVDSEQKRLKNMVLAATRELRFERVTKNLKVKRTFSTLVEELKAINSNTPKRGKGGDDALTEVMEAVAHSDRSPVLLFMGGGMGAGKSTVLKEILKEAFWSEAATNAVVVEADAFKETDVIYRALSSKGHRHDMLQTAELVHQTSTDAASSLLVTALNKGRDVIMDGTLSWEPFVEQTIAMARNVHKHRYRMGVGYKVSEEDGTITENYWEKVEEEEEEEDEDDDGAKQWTNVKKKPYRIELVGVVCDAYLAVVRGIRRAIAVKRAVRVNAQLKSHKRFANAFPKYCHLVDNARLYCTNAIAVPPRLIGWKDGDSNLLIDEDEIKCLKRLCQVNEEADSIYELYTDPNVLDDGSVWKELVLSPTRPGLQHQLKNTIQKIENSTL